MRRITVALDDESFEIFKRISESVNASKSEIVRRVLKFYFEYGFLEGEDRERIMMYVQMLSEAEHVIIDVDHLVSMLNFVNTHPEKERFWDSHREIARAHAEEFRGKDPKYVLERLEACNFFRKVKMGENEYTLILCNDILKDFVKVFIEEVLKLLGYEVEIREDIAKLRVKYRKISSTPSEG